MTAAELGAGTASQAMYQDFRDSVRSSRYENDVAQRHRSGSRLAGSPAIDRDQVDIVTTALTLPPTMPLSPDRSVPLSPDRSLPAGAQPLPGGLDAWLTTVTPDLIAIRHHLHAHPELSGQEFETAAMVARELAIAGLTPRLLPKGNGVLCDIPGASGGPVVALRADLDALPLPDVKNVPYRSKVPGACHACGHDVHTTILLGVGFALARLAERGLLPGPVRLIFQPSEEAFPSGAPEVIAAGGLTDVSAIFALHCAPQLPVGQIGVRSGPFTASSDVVDVTLRGPGGHTARPHLTADLLHALGRVIVDVPALLDRRVDARTGVSMVWAAVRAGEAANTIPSVAQVRGTVRTLSKELRGELPELVSRLVHEVVAGTGAQAEVNYCLGVPPVVNDRVATAVVESAAAAALGTGQVVEAEISMGGEDFAYYLEEVPGAMLRLGVGVPDATTRLDIHQSTFDIDDRAIGHGVRAMVHTALTALRTCF